MKYKTFKVIAKIELSKNGRTLPIKSGYRPAFNFIENKFTSGSIYLIDRSELKVGEQCTAEISFHSDELLGNLKEGTEFNFFEPPNKIGKGNIIGVLGWIND